MSQMVSIAGNIRMGMTSHLVSWASSGCVCSGFLYQSYGAREIAAILDFFYLRANRYLLSATTEQSGETCRTYQ
jgi:hypothetical protein